MVSRDSTNSLETARESHILLKDAAMGYVSIQTVCSVLRADLYRAWT